MIPIGAKHPWTYVGWLGTFFLLSVIVELSIPLTRGRPFLIFGSLLISLGLCTSAGIFHRRWFLLPGIVAVGFIALLLLSVFSE
jgi:hypothetical protein